MNALKITVVTLAAGLLTSGAHAVAIYTVKNGHTGTAVFSANGVCKSKVAYENAVYGTVYNFQDDAIGTGLVSAEGSLLALLDEGVKLSSFQAVSGLKFSSTYYVDFSSNATETIFGVNGGCDIFKTIPNPQSRKVYSADINKGFDKLTLKYSFTGYQPFALADKNNGDTVGNSASFKGSISFKGSRPVL